MSTEAYPPDDIEPMLEWLRTWRDEFGSDQRGATSCWNAIDEIMNDLKLRRSVRAPWDARVRAGNALGPAKITSIAGVPMSLIHELSDAFEEINTEDESLEAFAIAAVRAGWRPTQKENTDEPSRSLHRDGSLHAADCMCGACRPWPSIR